MVQNMQIKHFASAWALDLAERYGVNIELLTVIPLLETFLTRTYSAPGKIPL